MLLTLMKCKLHAATITECDIDYEGSIAIDRGLMEAAGLVPHERVDIYNITNGERLTTYVIVAPEGSGKIGLNGAAARRAARGDKVIIAAYAQMSQEEAEAHQPTVLLMDDNNRVKDTAGSPSGGGAKPIPIAAVPR
jgi:aspartate 1-decarboxylase